MTSTASMTTRCSSRQPSPAAVPSRCRRNVKRTDVGRYRRPSRPYREHCQRWQVLDCCSCRYLLRCPAVAIEPGEEDTLIAFDALPGHVESTAEDGECWAGARAANRRYLLRRPASSFLQIELNTEQICECHGQVYPIFVRPDVPNDSKGLPSIGCIENCYISPALTLSFPRFFLGSAIYGTIREFILFPCGYFRAVVA